MKINKNNYESFFLDFIEGRLDASLRVEFEKFLELNPDLNTELEEFESFSFPVDSETKFSNKFSLKKLFISVGEINENNYEDYLVAEMEGDLSNEEAKNLKSFISKNPFVETEQKLFQKTILHPDKTIVFADKNKFKKPVVVQLYWRQAAAVMAIAASVLLILYLNFRNNIIISTDGMKNTIVQRNQETKQNQQKEETVNMQAPKEKNVVTQNQKPERKSKIVKKKKNENILVVKKNQEELKSDKIIKVENTLITEKKNETPVTETQVIKAEEKKEIAEDVKVLANSSEVNILNENKEIVSATEGAISLKEFLTLTFKKNVLKESHLNRNKKKDKEKITLLDLASALVKGASKVFGKEISMKTQYNENEKATAVVFTSPMFEISQTLH